MSGTSLDGVDLVYTKIYFTTHWHYKILHTQTVPYYKSLKRNLAEALDTSKENIKKLDATYTKTLARIINGFIVEKKIDKSQIDFLSSHGHTILHQPEKGITLQIGNNQELADLTKLTTICDFRAQDVKLGGQGAPLIPIGDKLLFSEYVSRINLGGIANISFENDVCDTIAYDISPMNLPINFVVKNMNLDFDDKGKLASEGEVIIDLLNEFNSLSFYKNSPPKSLGLEWVKREFYPIINKYLIKHDQTHSSIVNTLATLNEHIAIQLVKNINKAGAVLITGGGAYNDDLIRRIKSKITAEIIIPARYLIEYKEALVFGFLGVLKQLNQINVLSSVTGARINHSSGVIFYPQ